jgi:hypothetical protein
MHNATTDKNRLKAAIFLLVKIAAMKNGFANQTKNVLPRNKAPNHPKRKSPKPLPSAEHFAFVQ